MLPGLNVYPATSCTSASISRDPRVHLRADRPEQIAVHRDALDLHGCKDRHQRQFHRRRGAASHWRAPCRARARHQLDRCRPTQTPKYAAASSMGMSAMPRLRSPAPEQRFLGLDAQRSKVVREHGKGGHLESRVGQVRCEHCVELQALRWQCRAAAMPAARASGHSRAWAMALSTSSASSAATAAGSALRSTARHATPACSTRCPHLSERTRHR